MERFSHNKLEFEKVLKMVQEYAFSNFGKSGIMDLKPSENPGEELKKTREMVHLLIQEGDPPVGGIFDIRPQIEKAISGDVLEPLELLKVRNTLEGIKNLKDWYASVEENYAYIESIIRGISPFESLIKKIDKTINDDGLIKDNATSKLKTIRNEKKTVERRIKKAIEKYNSGNFSNNLQQQGHLIRDGRYVLPIKSESKSRINGIIHSSSSSGATYYMEPAALVELNDRNKEMESREKEEINRILRELSMFIIDKRAGFQYNNQQLVAFDMLWAKAKFAKSKKAVVPGLNKGTDFTLLNIRHPLIKEGCVPITVSIERQKHGIVITGPNTGGKTVTLKTIGLAHLMGLCGIPILADRGSRIGHVNSVLADIGDEQSIEQSLSTFSGHLKKITEIVKTADEHSLVLLDELGAGTDPVEGAALALGLLDVLLDKGCKLIVTSHLTPIKLYCYGNERLMNASVSFDIETLSPTYKLRVGIAGSSNAFEIAKRLGVPEEVLNSADKFKNEEYANVDEILNTLHSEKEMLEQEKAQAQQLRKSLEEKESTLKNKLEKVRDKKIEGFMDDIDEIEAYINRIKKEAETTVSKLRKDSSQSFNEIRDMNKQIDEIKSNKMNTLKEKLENTRTKEQKISIDTLSKGDWLKIRGTEIPLKIVDKREGKYIVEKGGIKIEVKPKDALRAEKEEKKTVREDEKIYQYYDYNRKPAYNSTRLDLRGNTVEEALEKIEGFIHSMIINNEKTGYLIHGKGTGRLAEGIWERLNQDSRIANFRIGKPKEGGTGATVITLN